MPSREAPRWTRRTCNWAWTSVPDLMLHCGQEMNHLAQFLPELYAEFSS